MKINNIQTTAVTLTYDNGHTCRLGGCPLYDGYPFTVCDDCWPKTEIGRDEASEPDEEVVSPDHVILPRAEVEALRAIAGAAQRWHDAGADNDAAYHALVDLLNAVAALHGSGDRYELTKREPVAQLSLHDLPPLTLAPLPEGDA